MFTEAENAPNKEQDKRVDALNMAREVQADLAENRPLRILLDSLKQSADDAMDTFADINPADTNAIIGLQSKVRAYVYATRVFTQLIEIGKGAEASLDGESPRENDFDD